MDLKELIKQLTREVLDENELNSMSTMEELIHQAEEDGYIFGDYGQYILSAAKKVADKFDQLPAEEQKVMRDTYYKAFLRMVGKINEETGTGAIGVGGGPIATPNWVAPSGQKKNKATKQAEKEGWKATKGETEMPGDSKVKDYKSLTGKKKKKVKIYQEDSNYTQKSKYQISKPTINLRGGPSLATKGGGYYASAIKENQMNLNDIIDQELLNEVTYHKFKNEVKFRTKNEQLHKAIREVKRKLSEIDRIVEYTSRMKQELSEGEEGLKYWKNTEKNVATISEMVNTLNNKIKNLQQ